MESSVWVQIAGVMTLLILAAKPVLDIYRNWSSHRKEGVVNSVESLLYRQLSEQLTQNTEALQRTSNEKNNLFEKYVKMEVRLAHLEQNEGKYIRTIQAMEERMTATELAMTGLIRKNEELSECVAEKNEIIHKQHLEIRELIDQIRPLELKLASRKEEA